MHRLASLRGHLFPAAALAVGAMGAVAALAPAEAAAAPPSPLSPQEFRPFKLAAIERVSHNTAVYRFALPDSQQVVGLPVASCVVTRAPIGAEGKPVIRPYTPISAPDARGHFDLIVKSYEQGVMSKHFASLKVGDTLDVKGPILKLSYTANMKQSIGFVAGGTGIAPMLQMIEEILRNPVDKTQLSLVYGSVSESDILLKARIDALAKKHASQFKVTYVLDKAPKGWTGASGFITSALLKEKLAPPSGDTMVIVCGPPGLMAAISGPKSPDFTQGDLGGALLQLGYTKESVFKM